MATPDAIAGGYLDFLLERLAAFGFEVRGCRLFELDWQRLARMYHHREDPPPSGADELPQSVMTRLYRLAPAAVLVVAKPAGSACADLLRCKGATRPAEADPGTVRHAGEHLIFNYLHCPDDPAAAALELGYLLGPAEAGAFMALADGPADPDLAALLGPAQLQQCLPAFSGREAIAFPMIANRLRCRVVARQAVRSLLDRTAIARLREAHELLLAERALLGAAPTATARHAIAREAGVAIQAALAATAGGDRVLEDGLAALARLGDFADDLALEAVLALGGSGIYMSELEKVGLDAWWHAVRSEAPAAVHPE